MSNVVELHNHTSSMGEQTEMRSNSEEMHQVDCEDNHHGVCAICLNKIVLQETALVKGCEHAYWRWGDNGYVRTGKQEARPAHRPNSQDSGAGSSRQTKNKETAVPKCEAADKVAAEKHHL